MWSSLKDFGEYLSGIGTAAAKTPDFPQEGLESFFTGAL
jgi:hypothetical protein